MQTWFPEHKMKHPSPDLLCFRCLPLVLTLRWSGFIVSLPQTCMIAVL
jgi:hypothetical protein